MTRSQQRDIREARKGRIIRLLRDGPLGVTEIAACTLIKVSLARTLLGELRQSGEVECSGLGPDATWRAIV